MMHEADNSLARVRWGWPAAAVSAVLGIVAIVLGGAAVVLASRAGSVPGTDFLLAAAAWVLQISAGVFWLGWLMWSMVNPQWRPGRRRAALVMLALVGIVLAGGFGKAAFTDDSLLRRFTGSESAMTAYAEDVIAGRQLPAPLRLGSYQFTTVNSEGSYIEFWVPGTIGITGFVYNPQHYALIPNDPSDSYRHLSGPWYVMDKPDQ